MKYTKMFRYSFLLSFVILSLSLLFPFQVQASVIFEDSFEESTIIDDWVENVVLGSGSGLWYLEDGKLVSSVTSDVSSQLYVNNSYSNCDYVIESNAIAIKGLDMSFLFRIAEDYSHYYMVDFRFHDPNYTQEYGNNYRLWRYVSTSSWHNLNDYKLLMETTPFHAGSRNLELGETVNVKIFVEGNVIKVYHDDVLVIDYLDLSNFNFQCGGFGLRSWGGSYLSKNSFLNYKVMNVTPISQEKHKKYILIPGLGASWNTRAMVYGDNVNNEDWSMTPFVTNYQNISSYFDSKNLDYDVWNYDWRRPLSEILSNFEEYVDENITEDDEVYIIGHSLGGLVARMWYQNNLDDNRIGKVITVGSPHKGAIKAYEAYNGGKLIEGYDFGWTVWNLYLTLISKGGSTMIDTIRKEAPILRDLSPTYEFLSKNNVLFPREQSEYFNLYLSDWNSNFNNWDKVWPIAGIGEETKYVINLKNRSIFDQVLDLWPDGKPDTYEYGDGDGTVLTESAGFGKENRIEVVGGHADLISTFLNRILYILEVEESNLSDAYGEYNGRIFYLGSPAEMKVKCEGIEEKSDNNGFVFVSRTENDSNCQVKIQGTDDGVYHLVLADTQLNNWQYYENRIKENDEDVFEVDNRANLTKSIVNENFMSEMIQGDVNKLQEIFKKEEYKNVKKAISRKDWKYVIDWSLSFRRKHREQFYTKRIVENCIRIETNRISHSKTNWRNNYVKVAENLLNILQKFGHMKGYGQKEISTFEANNYYWMENTLDRIKTSNDSGEKFLLFNTFIKLFSMF